VLVNKINSISNQNFKGYRPIKNETGETITQFTCPYDFENETCEVQIFKITPNDKYNYKINETPVFVREMVEGRADVNLQSLSTINKNENIAYNYVIKDKNTGKVKRTIVDTGVQLKPENGEHVFRVNPKEPIENFKYNLMTRKGTTPFQSGSAYIVIPDSLNPGAKFRGFDAADTGAVYVDEDYQKQAENEIRNFSNRFGGNIAGLINKIPYLKENGYSSLVSLPIANGDDKSSHGYWNKNNLQIAPSMGNTENIASLFENLYANGIKYVYDGTFTSEGLEGIHFQYASRWGSKNPQTEYWFRMSDLKNSNLGLGVVPQNKENLRHRVINPPVIFEQTTDGKITIKKNPDYNPNKETLFQIYDAKQASERQISDYDKAIKRYEGLTSGKELDFKTHDDTLINYIFQVNPEEYIERLNVMKGLNQKSGQNIQLNSADGTIILAQFSNFKIDKKTEGGFVTWDANTDMAKMNYHISGYDEKLNQSIVDRTEREYKQKLQQRGAFEVQDLTIQTGRYWTKMVKEVQTAYTAKTIGNAKNAEAINKLIEQGKLPNTATVDNNVVNNILNGYYMLEPKGVEDKDSVTLKALMSLPLDALEFGENTVGVLSTSYFSNRATNEETLGKSRFELYKTQNPHLVEPYTKNYNKTNELFTENLKQFTDNVIQEFDKLSDEKLLDSEGNYTEYGEYIIELVGKDIAKYALLKSLSGDSFKTKVLSDGRITYDYDLIRENTTLKSLGINANSPEEEAQVLHSKMKKGLNKLNSNDINFVAKSLQKRFQGTDTMSFRLAEALVDRAGKGLDWRLDAAKDVMDQDAVRNGEASFDDTWNNVINFWAKFVQGVKQENPNSYIVAEITDIEALMKDNLGKEACPYEGHTNIGSMFNGEPDAMVKFYNETGITSEAGYSYFFTNLLTAVSGDFEKGDYNPNNHYDFMGRLDALMKTRSPEYIRNLFSFMGNHDKPRMVHGLALDMGLFHSNLQNSVKNFAERRDHRLAVMQVLSGAKTVNEIPLELRLNADNMDYFRSNISTKAVAMSKLLIDSANEDLKGIASDEDVKLLVQAFRDLANGNYLGNGNNINLQRMTLLELTSLEGALKEILKLAEAHGLRLTDTEKNKLINEVITLVNNNNLVAKYTINGGFDWTEPKEVGERNRELAEKLLSKSDEISESGRNNVSNVKGYDQYSLYSMSLAGLLREAFQNSESAKNSDVKNAFYSATNDYVVKYNRDFVEKNSNNTVPLTETADNATRKNAYGARDIETALNMAIKQVEHNTGKTFANKEKVVTTIYKSVTEPAVTKAAMLMTFLAGLPGMPAMYGGDELGMTGYEEKAKNIFLQNRNALQWGKLEGNSDMAKYRRDIMLALNSAMGFRNDSDLSALNLGTPQYVDTSNDSTRAFMMEDGNNATISIFNAAGIDHRNRVDYFAKYGLDTMDKRRKFFEENNISTLNINNRYIPIMPKSELDYLLLGSSLALPIGTIFINANSRDKAEYVVKQIGDRIGIVKKGGGKITLDGLTAKNGVMILKKVKNVAFRGSQYSFATNPYKLNEETVQGEKLSLLK